MSDKININDDLDLEGTRYPREEAARLVQSSLRQSRFLILTNIHVDDSEYEQFIVRNYGVDFPDTVPVVKYDLDPDDPHELIILDILCDHLRKLLPRGGVICVPPPVHLLCEVCRIGIKEEGLVNKEGKEVCSSCYIGTNPIAITNVSTTETGDK